MHPRYKHVCPAAKLRELMDSDHPFGDIVSGLDILIGLLGFLLKPRIGKPHFEPKKLPCSGRTVFV